MLTKVDLLVLLLGVYTSLSIISIIIFIAVLHNKRKR